ncbi:hypothetical protein [Methylobacterium planeticum]|uniref:Uncharacterized protein n=1 Tax=Methylobacterium planeticum TaxID=2615211 RepID=A0A6N6MU76_9HYPH|nr:hypothetical protein [Methylobacterium planeticum]KAB1072313.1 hypothetical protein F6X51_16540 [Methylobacterium planeticum]
MAPREAAAASTGFEIVRRMSMAAAVTMESRDDATDGRKQTAVAALSARADGARSVLIGKSETASHSQEQASNPSGSIQN